MMKVNKRKVTQVVTAILYNCNLTGFAKGTIYKGKVKSACVPGLNCYSCPGAVGACPLGSLQAALVSSRYKFPYYMLGIIILFGVLLGRFICGFLCPFGLLQELLHKIPSPKLKKSKLTRALSWLKYGILVVFVVVIPIVLAIPGFCKFICPQGTLEGGLPLVSQNEALQNMIGFLFNWKVSLLIAFLVAMVFIYRVFCRFVCPLGALYSFFNGIAFARVEVDETKCNHCNACIRQCKMDIKKVGDHECIQCGECMSHCKQNAIHRHLL